MNSERNIFGWSYPPGAANDPNAPWNQTDQPCDICGKFPDDCICPECPSCGQIGELQCYDGFPAGAPNNHGLVRTAEQIASFAAFVKEQDAQAADDKRQGDYYYVGQWRGFIHMETDTELECMAAIALAAENYEDSFLPRDPYIEDPSLFDKDLEADE